MRISDWSSDVCSSDLDIGRDGQQMIQTPNIDALARKGMRFTNFYSGSTVCAPSREALLIGKHTGHTYIRGNFNTGDPEGDLSIPGDKKTIAEYLKPAGYETAIIGKWGIGSPGEGDRKSTCLNSSH